MPAGDQNLPSTQFTSPDTLGEIHLKIQRLTDLSERSCLQQEKIAEDITKIKEAVYNPDEGLYARLRELEAWKKTSNKLVWMFVASVVGMSVMTAMKMLGAL